MQEKIPQFDYDFIVTGAGAAGRSFVYQLLQSPLCDSRILLIDREIKEKDDRTWSYWENQPGLFEEIVHHSWENLWFHNDGFSRKMNIAPYRYKMILAADYYRFTNRAFVQKPHIQTLTARVQELVNTENGVAVTTDAGTFTAPWCINSIGKPDIDKKQVHYLDQHFRGWFIRCKKPIFKADEAVMMDFRTPQQNEFRFLYLLPTSTTEALIEVAIFSNNHLKSVEYDKIIDNYLKTHWPQLTDYTIERTEQGNIPMTDHHFQPHEGHIVHLGQVGGDTRASTGYTFIYIHRRVKAIIQQLVKTGDPRVIPSFNKKRHHFYDSVMLQVLQNKTYPGDQLFQRLFANNPPQRLLRFLNAESALHEEVALGLTAPLGVFSRTAIKTLLH